MSSNQGLVSDGAVQRGLINPPKRIHARLPRLRSLAVRGYFSTHQPSAFPEMQAYDGCRARSELQLITALEAHEEESGSHAEPCPL